MPELPEVETIAIQLRRSLIGLTVREVGLHRPDYVRAGAAEICSSLPGRRIEAVERHGKRMTLVLSDSVHLLLHLGMSGRVLFERRNEPPAAHTHLTIAFRDSDRELRVRDPRRFGGVWFMDGVANSLSPNAALGPDALTIASRQLRTILSRRRQIKAILMDQRLISGLGNIYCDEALFRAGIHPLTQADALETDAVRRLANGIRHILRSAVRHGGSTFREYRDSGGRAGSFQQRHRVYGRAGKPCHLCRRRIESLQVAGRTTHVCTACQPLGKSQTKGSPRRFGRSGAV